MGIKLMLPRLRSGRRQIVSFDDSSVMNPLRSDLSVDGYSFHHSQWGNIVRWYVHGAHDTKVRPYVLPVTLRSVNKPSPRARCSMAE